MSCYGVIELFHYYELSEKAKNKVKIWLDEYPYDYETEDEDGNIVTEYQYFSELEDQDIQDHCFMNDYIFNHRGEPMHHLLITQTEHEIDKGARDSFEASLTEPTNADKGVTYHG